jgi:hypothetical protein
MVIPSWAVRHVINVSLLAEVDRITAVQDVRPEAK